MSFKERYIRNNSECETFEECYDFFKEKTIQLYMDGFNILDIQRVGNIGTLATFFKNNVEYHSFYIYKSLRNRGIYKKLVKKYNWNIISSVQCGINYYLNSNNIRYTNSLNFMDCNEYRIISDYYGDEISNRGIPFMNHIDEGLCILKWLGTTLNAKKAFCLHPIYQDDKSFVEFLKVSNNIDQEVVTYCMEFRRIANNYLSNKKISSISMIDLSPIEEVNMMIIADKIQNRKDFELSCDTVNRSQYFSNWFRRLDISEDRYRDYKNRLIIDNQMIN